MLNIDDFLDEVKEKTGSDYKTAKHLGIGSQFVSNWRSRRQMPSNLHVIELCDYANIDVGLAVRAIEYSRANERALKEAGFSTLSMMLTLGVGSFGAMSLLKMSALPYEALGASFFLAGNCILCKIDGQVLVVGKVESKLLHLGVHELSHLLAANDSEVNQVSTNSQNQSLVYAKFGKP